MGHLAPCPTCNRHVVANEATCPFCSTALSESFRRQPAPQLPQRRLSRAALVAAGAALMGAGGPACTRTSDTPAARRSVSDAGDGTTGAREATGGIQIIPLDAAASPAVDTRRLSGIPRAIYGAPVPGPPAPPNRRPPRGSSKARP